MQKCEFFTDIKDANIYSTSLRSCIFTKIRDQTRIKRKIA